MTRTEVKKLICLLTRDNLEATHHLNRLISEKIMMAVRGHHTHPDLVDSVRHEMSLLRVTVIKDDSCWEERIKCVIRLFLTATKEGKTSPVVMENITLPCLKILHELVRPAVQLNGSNPHQILAEDPSKKPDQEMASVSGAVDVEQVSSRQLLTCVDYNDK